MRVCLDRDTVIRLCCYCREAERSVHRALDAAWSEFRAYYSSDKVSGIQELIRHLDTVLSSAGRGEPVPASEDLHGLISPPGLFRYLFGRWIARTRTTWSFPAPALRFVGATLKTLLTWLSLPTKPAPQALIGLRRDICSCSGMIESRCFGLPEIERAKAMDHFHRTEWLPFVTLAEVLGDQPAHAPPTRQSA